jgi:hypothetical protein
VSGQGERASRLERLAGELDPAPSRMPFYVQRPDVFGGPLGNPAVRAPGWYMVRAGDHVYLGYSAGDAEQTIRDLAREKPARKRARA